MSEPETSPIVDRLIESVHRLSEHASPTSRERSEFLAELARQPATCEHDLCRRHVPQIREKILDPPTERARVRTASPQAAYVIQACHRPQPSPASGMAGKRNSLSPSSTLIPANELGDLPGVATVPASSHAPRHPLDTRFVLLRMGTLILVSGLYTLGTFAIRPDAVSSRTPILADAPRALAFAAPTPASELVKPPKPTNTATVEPPTATTTPVRDDPTVPATTAAARPPEPPSAGPPTKEPPSITSPVFIDPEQPPEPPVQPETTPTTPPEPDFPYNAARAFIKEQHVYLRTECLGKRPKRPLNKLKFIADVRPSGRASIRVVANDKNVRACVRDLFVFPFDPSPRGGAFEYTLSMTFGTLKPVPVDPERVK